MAYIRDKKACVSQKMHLHGCIHDTAMFLQSEQLLDKSLWERFVDQYREAVDAENQGWRGEYWGKMMRGAALVYAYTQSDELYRVLTETVTDMLTVIEPDGRVSSYAREGEFDSWDLWGRKYVMLGMLYYRDICNNEELKQQIVHFLSRLLDYIIVHIGPEAGKKPITSASRSWLGLNASSILEPVVWLYRLTDKAEYLDFATYIVQNGGAEGVNIFELAFENQLYPYQYGVSKAYEMMSCFEGLLEYALITGSERYKTACINFCKAIIDSDVSIIGSCGCTDELLDHAKQRQTASTANIMQETCVTVTWMKLCSRLLRLTGERIFADCMEQSFYNAYMGALNTEHRQCDHIHQRFQVKTKVEGLVDTFLPFDSYSPLRPGRRGKFVGGLQLLPDKSYYGCCTCIGAAGVGVMAKHTVLECEDGISIEFYEAGQQTVICGGQTVKIIIDTIYPADGLIKLTVIGAQGRKLYLRIPGWCEKAVADRPGKIQDGYMVFANLEHKTQITLELAMQILPVLPVTWEEDVICTDRKASPKGWHSTGFQKVYHKASDDDFIAFTRGPLTLCADSRTGKPADSVFRFLLPPVAQIATEKEIIPGETCLLRCELKGTDGSTITLVDYASAGRDWNTLIAAWLPTK